MMSDSYPNLEVEYLYRDAGNYKIHGKRVILCPSQRPVDELEQILREALIDGEYFLPEALGIPKPTFGHYDSELDHDWLEIIGLCRTKQVADTHLDFFIFVKNMERLKQKVLP